ncbi:type V secretion system putative substrate protein [Acinetobacter calcoaceticus]|uniref:Type V secretion system putative substrate protein n=1 Tax=Acinetobacter calcoaceticus TaxID=471 RepID=A0A4R1XUV9_ACICA|nr:type V secretion system putative substrate protein [Acinetobacter calcoaceticus]
MLNKIYKCIWNNCLNKWVVACETMKGRSKTANITKTKILTSVALIFSTDVLSDMNNSVLLNNKNNIANTSVGGEAAERNTYLAESRKIPSDLTLSKVADTGTRTEATMLSNTHNNSLNNTQNKSHVSNNFADLKTIFKQDTAKTATDATDKDFMQAPQPVLRPNPIASSSNDLARVAAPLTPISGVKLTPSDQVTVKEIQKTPEPVKPPLPISSAPLASGSKDIAPKTAPLIPIGSVKAVPSTTSDLKHIQKTPEPVKPALPISSANPIASGTNDIAGVATPLTPIGGVKLAASDQVNVKEIQKIPEPVKPALPISSANPIASGTNDIAGVAAPLTPIGGVKLTSSDQVNVKEIQKIPEPVKPALPISSANPIASGTNDIAGVAAPLTPMGGVKLTPSDQVTVKEIQKIPEPVKPALPISSAPIASGTNDLARVAAPLTPIGGVKLAASDQVNVKEIQKIPEPVKPALPISNAPIASGAKDIAGVATPLTPIGGVKLTPSDKVTVKEIQKILEPAKPLLPISSANPIASGTNDIAGVAAPLIPIGGVQLTPSDQVNVKEIQKIPEPAKPALPISSANPIASGTNDIAGVAAPLTPIGGVKLTSSDQVNVKEIQKIPDPIIKPVLDQGAKQAGSSGIKLNYPVVYDVEGYAWFKDIPSQFEIDTKVGKEEDQFYNSNNKHIFVFGGEVSVDTNPDVIEPSYRLGGKNMNNITDVVSNLDARTTTNTQKIELHSNNIAELNSTQSQGAFSVSANSNGTTKVAKDAVIDYGNNDSNIKVAQTGTQFKMDLADQLNVKKALTIEGTRLDRKGLRITQGPSVQTEGINAANTVISHLKEGVSVTDAVNKGQLEKGMSTARVYTDQSVEKLTGQTNKNISLIKDQVSTIQNGLEGMLQVSQEAPIVQPKVTGTDALAGGNAAQSSGHQAVALGNKATATAQNSVALGNSSVADRENTVSVGSKGKERQVSNVAAGTADTDAANVRQLKEVSARMTETSDQLNQKINRVNEYAHNVDKNAKAGIAGISAMANIPQVMQGGQRSVGAGVGHYRGQNALAIGGSVSSDSGKWVFKGSAAFDTQSKSSFGAGVSRVW